MRLRPGTYPARRPYPRIGSGSTALILAAALIGCGGPADDTGSNTATLTTPDSAETATRPAVTSPPPSTAPPAVESPRPETSGAAAQEALKVIEEPAPPTPSDKAGQDKKDGES